MRTNIIAMDMIIFAVAMKQKLNKKECLLSLFLTMSVFAKEKEKNRMNAQNSDQEKCEDMHISTQRASGLYTN